MTENSDDSIMGNILHHNHRKKHECDDENKPSEPFIGEVIFYFVKSITSRASRRDIDGDLIPVMSETDEDEFINLLSKLSGEDLGLEEHSHLQIVPPTPFPLQDIRYFHIHELEDQYSIGIFFMPPHTEMPLHDHPYMWVFSRILTGSVAITSLDWINPNDKPCSETTKRRARLTEKGFFHAPNTVFLTPEKRNMHMIKAGSQGCAFLDILIPPYNENNLKRDCSYYEMEPTKDSGIFDLSLTEPSASFNIVRGTLDV
mmetsp:Transcript_11433/g.17014  ORF Transcript_11433/g.17014 Transcript_11433/m.17014 type:complete len:258 (+) Transcript_11433:150-923(+)|eukprot:CAMPEP_0171454202 /NCGR_PEP_ID=MMETSP0945-20130129/1587_1 /TAXON_ID=109269 /ORGANISM="Vaucheria litorea, Strain CCMP2940" /LENGTH=257 /DNA_ID=CAMNT_0011979187 /DNA_START=140 /DNA_END=913 /DNA_ORIENTATION=-